MCTKHRPGIYISDAMSSQHEAGGGRKRVTQMSGNHLLGFSTRRDRPATSHRSTSRYYQMYDKSMFLAANFRFGMVHDVDCSSLDGSGIDWDDVVFLDMESSMSDAGMHGVRCPISLDTIELPYITPCGHMFSLVSLVTDMLIKHDGALGGVSPCPICNVDVRATELRPVHIRYVRDDPRSTDIVGKDVLFSLVWRYRTSMVVHGGVDEEDMADGYYPIDMPLFSTCVVVENPDILWKYIACTLAEKSEQVRREGGQDAEYYYPGYLAAIDVVLDQCKSMRERALKSNNDSGDPARNVSVDDIKHAVNNIIEKSKALEISRRRDQKLEEEFPTLSISSIPVTSDKRSVSSCVGSQTRDGVRCRLPREVDIHTKDDKIYMYQKSDGQRIFLNLFNMKMLHTWKEHYEDLPSSICATILDVDPFEQTEETRKRMRPFSHVPVRASITTCEVDLHGVLPKAILNTFEQELSKRRSKREALARQKARKLRFEEKKDKELKTGEIAILDLKTLHMPPLGSDGGSDAPDTLGNVFPKEDLIEQSTSSGVSFAKIAELGFAALGPSLTDGKPPFSPAKNQSLSDPVWGPKSASTSANTEMHGALPSVHPAPSGRKKGSKQRLLFSTSNRQY